MAIDISQPGKTWPKSDAQAWRQTYIERKDAVQALRPGVQGHALIPPELKNYLTALEQYMLHLEEYFERVAEHVIGPSPAEEAGTGGGTGGG